MKEPISLKDIFAVLLKRVKLIICVCLAGAVLAGTCQLFLQWKATAGSGLSEEERELQYQNAKAEYDATKQYLEQAIVDTEAYAGSLREYMAQSLLTNLDPNNRPVSQTVLAIGDVDSANAEADIEQIRTMYSLMWDSADLSTELTNHPYTHLGSQFLREVVSVVYYDGGTLVISAAADTAEGTRALCDAAHAFLVSAYDTVEASTRAHTLSVVSSTDSFLVDESLKKTQLWQIDELNTNEANCDSYRQQLAELKEPVKNDGAFHMDFPVFIKWCVMGAVLGILLACICILTKYVVSDHVENSKQLAALLCAPYLGSTAKVKDIWRRLALGFADEPHWATEEEGKRYLSENVAARIQENATVALITTLKVSEDEASVQSVLQILRSQGHAVTYVNQGYCNPDAIRAIRENRYIIFVEEAGKTSRGAVAGVRDLVQQLDGRILGFVLI